MRALFLTLALVGVSPTLFAVTPGEASTALIRAENAWALHGPRSYQFTLEFHEFVYMYCTEYTFRVIGHAVQVRKPPDCRSSRDTKVFGTIPRLLRYARKLLPRAGSTDFTVDYRFDETTGVPYSFGYTSKTIEDVFSAFEVTDFVAIAP